VGKVRDALWHLDGKRVGMLGLSFKPNTDDLREAPSIDVARDLLADGAQVVAYDPAAGEQAARTVPGLQLADKAVKVADGAHALVLMTEWSEFGNLEPDDLRARMAYPILVDARNALDAEAFLAAGFTVAGVGRPVRGPGDGSR
jgi:UDPglucose 6-dehydrogenase